jgi:hypothetical protein
MEKGLAYEVKDWFADKVAQEVSHNIHGCRVFSIMKETEKAVYAMLDLGIDHRKCMWVPKSVLVTYVPGEQENGMYKRETIFESDYDTCVEKLKTLWSYFK